MGVTGGYRACTVGTEKNSHGGHFFLENGADFRHGTCSIYSKKGNGHLIPPALFPLNGPLLRDIGISLFFFHLFHSFFFVNTCAWWSHFHTGLTLAHGF